MMNKNWTVKSGRGILAGVALLAVAGGSAAPMARAHMLEWSGWHSLGVGQMQYRCQNGTSWVDCAKIEISGGSPNTKYNLKLTTKNPDEANGSEEPSLVFTDAEGKGSGGSFKPIIEDAEIDDSDQK